MCTPMYLSEVDALNAFIKDFYPTRLRILPWMHTTDVLEEFEDELMMSNCGNFYYLAYQVE